MPNAARSPASARATSAASSPCSIPGAPPGGWGSEAIVVRLAGAAPPESVEAEGHGEPEGPGREHGARHAGKQQQQGPEAGARQRRGPGDGPSQAAGHAPQRHDGDRAELVAGAFMLTG